MSRDHGNHRGGKKQPEGEIQERRMSWVSVTAQQGSVGSEQSLEQCPIRRCREPVEQRHGFVSEFLNGQASDGPLTTQIQTPYRLQQGFLGSTSSEAGPSSGFPVHRRPCHPDRSGGHQHYADESPRPLGGVYDAYAPHPTWLQHQNHIGNPGVPYFQTELAVTSSNWRQHVAFHHQAASQDAGAAVQAGFHSGDPAYVQQEQPQYGPMDRDARGRSMWYPLQLELDPEPLVEQPGYPVPPVPANCHGQPGYQDFDGRVGDSHSDERDDGHGGGYNDD